MRRSLILGILAIVAFRVSAQDSQIPLPLTFNEVPKGDVNVVIRGADIFVRPVDLEQAGTTGPMWQRVLTFARLRGGSRIQAGGVEFISLTALAPLLTFKFDEANLSLSVTASPELLVPTALSVAGGPPKDLIYSKDTSTFLNYAATVGDVKSAFLESGTSIKGNLLNNSISKSPNQSWTRLLSSYSMDDRTRLRRWTFGDANISTDSLGASTIVGGATVSRNFSLDPYFVRFPPLNFKGMALTPSRVDIYVNGQIVSQQELPPGPFELRNVPVSAGAGNAQIVVRDVFGHEQTMATPYYFSTEVLAKNISEYVYSAGFVRNHFGQKSFDYGDPAIVGFHRIGWSDDLTLGGRFEVTRDVISAGPRVTKRTRFGAIGGAVAFSDEHGRRGIATELAYRYIGRHFSVGGTQRTLSRDYANLALRSENDRPLSDVSAFASILAGRVSYTLLLTKTNLRDNVDTDGITLITNMPVGKKASLFMSVGSVDQGTGLGRRPQMFAGLSFLFGATTTANISVDRRDGKTRILTDVQKAVGVGRGYGYRLQAGGTADDHAGTGAVQYQTDVGRYELNFNPFDTHQRPSVTASGGVVFQKGAVQFARAVEDSFALVRVPGVKNVRVYASNVPVGRTDSNGDLLVPNLLSYYGNRISIDDRDIPLNYEVLATERTVAPPFRGGAFIEFPVRQIRTVTGSVIIAPDVVPAYGQLTVNGGKEPFVSPLGRNGEFYLENIPSGTYPATIDYKLGSCAFSLQIPSGNDSVVKLGRLTCQEAKTP